MQVVESTTNCVVITSTAKQQPKLMDRVRADLRVRNYSLATERAYCHWIKRFKLLEKLKSASNIFRYYYPSATGNGVDLNEPRKLLSSNAGDQP